MSSYATMDIYYADSANDKAVIYCPGGGHSINWSDFPSCMHQWLKTF